MNYKKSNNQLNIYLLSKYSYTQIKNFPQIKLMTYNLVLNYKQKNKYYLFIHMIIMLIFYNPSAKTRFLFKTQQMNILELKLKSRKSIFQFLHNFIYIYFPRIDSFSTEFKFFDERNIIKFSFFKFPLIFELNTLFNSIEYLYSFINTYRFQLNLFFKKQKNFLLNYTYLQYYKLPILLS